jgi:hypothetical protein
VLTPEQIEYVKSATVNQADSLDWYEQRAGRITASSAHDVLRTDISYLSASVIIRVCSDVPSKLNVPAIVWGRAEEAIAREEYKDGRTSGRNISITKQFCYVHYICISFSCK